MFTLLNFTFDMFTEGYMSDWWEKSCLGYISKKTVRCGQLILGMVFHLSVVTIDLNFVLTISIKYMKLKPSVIRWELKVYNVMM